MDRPLKKIAFVVEDFSHGSPAQQMLDRFLIGYPRDGEFHKCGAEIHVRLGDNAADAELRRRIADYPVRRHATIDETVAGADGIVVVPAHVHAAPLAAACVKAAPEGAPVFVYGALAGDAGTAKEIAAVAASRRVAVASGTPLAVTWRLPDVDVPAGAPVKRALIVVQGERPLAELYALDGLLPLLERRKDGERGVRIIQGIEEVWTALDGIAPKRVLAAALSRSDSPQGDPVTDGRTQDLLGLGLVPKLAKNPRAWVIWHTDLVPSTILVLDGVVADVNFAVQLSDGTVISAQLYRPPAPQRHEFSRLAEVVERFFQTGKAPWPIRRSILTAGILKVVSGADPVTVMTPELQA